MGQVARVSTYETLEGLRDFCNYFEKCEKGRHLSYVSRGAQILGKYTRAFCQVTV